MLPLCVVVAAQSNLEETRNTVLSLVDSISRALHLDSGLRNQIKFIVFSNAASPDISDPLENFVEKESSLSPVQLRWIRSPVPLELFSFLKKFSKELDLH